MINSIHESVVSLLQNSGSGAGLIQWATDDQMVIGSPWYKEAPEPIPGPSNLPGFPFVVFDIPASRPSHTFTETYTEEYDVEVKVYCSSATTPGVPPPVSLLTSPYQLPVNSVIAFLDSFQSRPDKIPANNTTFSVIDWQRQEYEVVKEEMREPLGGRVWVGRAKYKCTVSAVSQAA